MGSIQLYLQRAGMCNIVAYNYDVRQDRAGEHAVDV